MRGTRKVLSSSSKKPILFQPDSHTKKHMRELYLMMYKDIYEFCERENICCMLGGGSALGAVRHQGFIPWDDDLDLNMPRADYMHFAKKFSVAYPDKYEVFVPDGEHRITNLFMKVSLNGTIAEDIYTASNPIKTGLSIDIFPIDNVPNQKLVRYIKGFLADIFGYAVVSAYMYQNRNLTMKELYTASIQGKLHYYLRITLGAMMSFRKYSWWYQKFDHWVQGPSESAFCTVPTGRGHYLGELRRKEVYYPLQNCTFENLPAWIPHQADAYLSQLFGDYMRIPSEQERESHFFTKINVD